MILDIIIIAMFLLFVIIGLKRGAAKTLLNLVGIVLAVFLSANFGSLLSEWIYKGFFQKGITQSIHTAIEQGGTDAFNNAVNSLPDFIYSLLSCFGVSKDYLYSLTENASASSQSVISQTIEGVISPILTSIISFFVIIILFILLMVLFKLLIKMLLGVFELPVLHMLNRTLGGILGALEAVAIVYLLVILTKLIIPFSGNEFFITQQLINESVIFKAIFDLNIFNSITQLSNSVTLITSNR